MSKLSKIGSWICIIGLIAGMAQVAFSVWSQPYFMVPVLLGAFMLGIGGLLEEGGWHE